MAKMIKNTCLITISLLIIISFSSSDATQEKHYLFYKFTAMTKTDAFMAVCESDDKQIAHYRNEDSTWVRENLPDWTDAPAEPPETREWYINHLYTLSNCTFAECPEIHVLQRIIGCELKKLPDGSNKIKIVDDYGHDGDDHSSNPDTVQWIDKNPKAKETKNKWSSQTDPNQFFKDFFKNCIDWISTFNNRIKSKPKVFVSARKAPDDHSQLVLTCLATGFYPRDVQMNIRLNRIKLEGQTSSGIRPNEDETFQRSISVKINRNHEGSYDCLVIHSSLTEPVSVEWDGMCSNCDPEPPWDGKGAIAAVLGVIVIVIVIGFVIRHCNNRRSSNDPMTRWGSYGSMEDRSQDDQSQEDQSEDEQ